MVIFKVLSNVDDKNEIVNCWIQSDVIFEKTNQILKYSLLSKNIGYAYVHIDDTKIISCKLIFLSKILSIFLLIKLKSWAQKNNKHLILGVKDDNIILIFLLYITKFKKTVVLEDFLEEEKYKNIYIYES